MDGVSGFLHKLLKSYLQPFSSAQVKKAASKRHFSPITDVRVAVTLLEGVRIWSRTAVHSNQ